MLQKVLSCMSNQLIKDETDSEEVKRQSEICHNIFQELNATLSEKQKELLFKLDYEHFLLCGKWRDDGIGEGLEAGFKFAFQLLVDGLR